MGALAPFYLAGLAALSLPLLLHLVRRTPRFRQQFSSLMFLKPTPPRLTRRSRLDQWLLLLMRLAALALLAAAFCRPFLRESALLTLDNLPARRIVLLIDVSASMRRGDLWQQALAAARKELDELGPRDEAALLAFHYNTETLVGFDDAGEQSGAARTELLRKQLESLKPSWGGTDLGVALASSAAMLESAADLRPAVEESQIVLISDVQQGSRFSALQAVTWPERVRVVVRPVVSRATTNARLHLVQNEEATGDEDARVRVVNASNSTADQFFVRWAGGGAANTMDEVAVFVPPGQSRVVRLPRSTEQLSADRIELRGDDHDFDNRFYVVPRRKQNVHVLYVGDDSERDPQGLQYYLRLALDGDPLRNVTVRQSAEPDPTLLFGPDAPQLIVVTRELSNDFAAALKKYVARGATALAVPRDESAAKLFPALFDDVRLREKANDKDASNDKDKDDFDYLLFGDIDFTHPLFAPLANPKYSNFTKIHFWRRRAIELTAKTGASAPGTSASGSSAPGTNATGATLTSATPTSAATAGATTTGATRAVARFDNGDPAMIERTLQGGRLIGLASGWQPDESQLALSTRFVPMISALVDLSCGAVESAASVVVHEPMPLALLDRPGAARVDTTIARPDGTSDKVEQGAERYGKTDEPGVYRATRGDSEASCAVNLAGSESDTASLELAQLEQLGVRFGNRVSQAERVSQLRQQRDVELEGRQKIWRWLIVVALVVLIGETLWAGRATRAAQQSAEVAT